MSAAVTRPLAMGSRMKRLAPSAPRAVGPLGPIGMVDGGLPGIFETAKTIVVEG